MKNDKIINEFVTTRNHKYNTIKSYRAILNEYSFFNKLSLKELIEEAEYEENIGIRWKKRALRKRLIKYREYIYSNYSKSTVKIKFSRVLTFYKHYEIEIHELPYISDLSVRDSPKISFSDLPTKKIIRLAIDISSPKIIAIILFMVSTGCTIMETTNRTVKDYIDSNSEYISSNEVYPAIKELIHLENTVGTWKLKRIKTGKEYYTFNTPESNKAIANYLLTLDKEIRLENPLFDISPTYLTMQFERINERLNLGKVGYYNRFRSHMLRKFHASQLYNIKNGLTIEEIDSLQGRSKNAIRNSYFYENPADLKEKYIKCMDCLLINEKVREITTESKEYLELKKMNDLLLNEHSKWKLEVEKMINKMEYLDYSEDKLLKDFGSFSEK